MVGLGEELGWRGWLLPALVERNRSFAAATAITTLIWLVWVAVAFVILIASAGVLLAWLWKISGGSVGVVAIAHGSMNAPFMFFEESGRSIANDALLYQSLLYAGAAIVVTTIRRTAQ